MGRTPQHWVTLHTHTVNSDWRHKVYIGPAITAICILVATKCSERHRFQWSYNTENTSLECDNLGSWVKSEASSDKQSSVWSHAVTSSVMQSATYNMFEEKQDKYFHATGKCQMYSESIQWTIPYTHTPELSNNVAGSGSSGCPTTLSSSSCSPLLPCDEFLWKRRHTVSGNNQFFKSRGEVPYISPCSIIRTTW